MLNNSLVKKLEEVMEELISAIKSGPSRRWIINALDCEGSRRFSSGGERKSFRRTHNGYIPKMAVLKRWS